MIKDKPLRLGPTIRKGLERHRGKWPQIAWHANVSYSWVCKMAQDRTRNPRMDEVQRVLDVLYLMDNGKKLTRQPKG